MLIPQRVIQKIGLLDERYFMFCEEADLCYRIQKAGYKVLYNPAVKVIHIGQSSVKKAPVEMALILIGSKLFFIKEHYSLIQYYVACFWASIFFLIRALIFLIKGIFTKTDRQKNMKRSRMYFWAIVDVLIDSRKLREICP